MVKTFLQILTGFGLTGTGFYCGFLFLKSLENQANLLFIILAIVLIPLGSYFLFRAGKGDTTFGVKKMQQTNPAPDQSGFAQKLEENNAMDREWEKTNDARNRLKMLQAAGESQEN